MTGRGSRQPWALIGYVLDSLLRLCAGFCFGDLKSKTVVGNQVRRGVRVGRGGSACNKYGWVREEARESPLQGRSTDLIWIK